MQNVDYWILYSFNKCLCFRCWPFTLRRRIVSRRGSAPRKSGWDCWATAPISNASSLSQVRFTKKFITWVGSEFVPYQFNTRDKIHLVHKQNMAHQIYHLLTIFWLIWFINQRALYNHALSVAIVLHRHRHLCTPPPGTWLDIETSYLVHICTCVPIYAQQIFNDSDLQFLNGSHFGIFLWFAILPK